MRTVSGYGSIEYCAVMHGQNANNTEMFENLIKFLSASVFRLFFPPVFSYFHKWNKTLQCPQVKVK